MSEEFNEKSSRPEQENEASVESQEQKTETLITEKPQKKKKSKLFKLSIWLISLVVFVGLLLFGFDLYNDYSGFLKPFGKQTVNIPAGSDTDDIAVLLKKQGIVKYPSVFKLYVKLSKTGGSFMRGLHTVTTDLGYKEITKQLSEDAENRVKVTIPEGYWLSQIVDRFVEKGIGNKEIWQEALQKKYDFDFLKGTDGRETPLEGYLFPDTYYFYSDDTPETVIKTMLSQFEKVITELGLTEKAVAFDMTLDDTVKLASVIQSEVPTMSEMYKVSAVFHNRLNIKMKLQSCVTVLYALGEHKGFVSIADTKVESPYNTYYVEGLPLGPVSAPGKDALIAAVTPDPEITAGNYLYFYSPSIKEVIYSKTYAEHQKAIAKNKNGKGTATVG